MTDFWNNRFSAPEYVYGTEPNVFFRKTIEKIQPGNMLLPGEGEGRNAVFAASCGWKVVAFDSSTEGKKKALKLAKSKDATIDYMVDDLRNFNYKNNFFDCISLIFIHMPKDFRQIIHKKLFNFLKPGGLIVLEGFSKKQLQYNTGGPRDIDMLFSRKELIEDFSDMEIKSISEQDIFLNEGLFHNGLASTIQLTAIKKNPI